MSKIFKILLFTFSFSFLFLSATPVLAASEPICFKPQIKIPGMDAVFEGCPTGEGYLITALGIGQFIIVIFKYSIGIIGILAAIVLMVGGVIWLTAGGNQSKVGEAQNWIKGGLTGLILALCSFLLLSTLNPDLTVIKPIILGEIAELPSEEDTNPYMTYEAFLKAQPPAGCGAPATSGIVKGMKITNQEISSGSVKGKKLVFDSFVCPHQTYGCDNPTMCKKDKVDPKTLININKEKYSGMTCFDAPYTVQSETWKKLKIAADIAKNLKIKGKGYEDKTWRIFVKSALRTKEIQQTIWDRKLNEVKKDKKVKDVMYETCRWVSYPTYCAPHVQGIAVDVCLCSTNDDKKCLEKECAGVGKSSVTPDPVLKQAIKTIMISADFVRYEPEWWHFEYPSDPNLPHRVKY